MKWFKENWGMDKNSGWIKFYKDMEEMFADPIVDDGEQDTVDINTICTPQRPELDLKWKYCGFYTPLAKELGEEEAGHDHGEIQAAQNILSTPDGCASPLGPATSSPTDDVDICFLAELGDAIAR